MRKIICPIAFMVMALPVLAMLMVPHAVASPLAATLNVNSMLNEPDSNVGDGNCSSTPSGKCTLRAAVMQADLINIDTTILVPSGIYTLTIPPVGLDGPETGDLNLTAPASGSPVVTIIGTGASTTIIDANQNDRVFNIATGRTANISGVTIRNGSVSASSTGVGIYNGGSLTVSNSTLSLNNGGDGGGIFTIGTMTVTNSTFNQNNATAAGGGIDNDQFGTLTIVDSTISQNKANNNGGGINDFNSSANIYNTSTLFNDADSDRDSNGSGGGIFNDPTFTDVTLNLRNTLVAGNTLFNTTINDDCTGTIHS